jgi:ribosomal protein L29
MKATEIRKMSREDVVKQLVQQYAEVRNIQDQIRTGKEKDSSKSLKIKRNIARMLTVLNEMGEPSSDVVEAKSKSTKKK